MALPFFDQHRTSRIAYVRCFPLQLNFARKREVRAALGSGRVFMLTTLAVTLLVGTSALQTPARPLGRRAAIGTAAAASFLPVAAAFAAAADEAALITEIKEIKAKLDGAAA